MTTSTLDGETRRGHIVVATLAAWGHTKSAATLLCKLVRMKGIYASILVSKTYYEKILKEVDLRFIPGEEDDLKAMIRVIAVVGEPLPASIDIHLNSLEEAFKKMVSGEPVEKFPGSGVVVADVGPPNLILLDAFLHKTAQTIKEMTGGKLPVYAIASTVVIATFYHHAPERLGGGGDLVPKLAKISHLGERERFLEGQKIYRRIRNAVLNLPGLPPMYDYEHYPQKLIFDADIAHAGAYCHRFFEECDGIVINTSPLLEGPAIQAWKEWYGSRPVICPGPFDHPINKQHVSFSAEHAEVLAFMDDVHKKYGEKSLVYISFGSLFWSTEPEKIWAAIDVLIEKGIPFLFAHAATFATIIPQDVADRIRSCGFGYESSWTPQIEILNHKATGWFVSHCGHNSVLESLSAGVPIIAWPFEVDQPCNAAYISSVHHLGYELFEIRSGLGVLPIARLGNRAPAGTLEAAQTEFREVLEKAFGEDGKEKRKNVERFQKAIDDGWKDGGASWKEMEKIIDVLTDKVKD